MTGARATLLLAAAVLLLGGAGEPSRKERLAQLPEDERAWLTEYVAPIIRPEEEKVFLELTEPHERERFHREFWARREQDGLPFPLGPGYERRYEELRRLADEKYDGWRSDPGQMVLHHGEPSQVEPVRWCEHVFRDLELWTYAGGVRGIPVLLYYRFPSNAPRRLYQVGVRDSEIFAPDSCRQRVADLAMDCPPSPIVDKCKGPVCVEACRMYQLFRAVLSRQGSGGGAERERARLFEPAPISLEGIDRIRGVAANAADPKARTLSATGLSATTPVVRASKKERLAALPEDEREWLTDYVAPLILPEEEGLFLDLTEAYQREVFKREFWKRRERDGLAAPFGPGFERRYEELRPRLDSVYDGWREDAARMVLRNGEPADIHVVAGCDKTFRDLEIWSYVNPGMARQTIHFFFYRPRWGMPRRLWRETSPRGLRQGQEGDPFDEVFAPGSCRKTFPSLRLDCQPDPKDPCQGPVCFEACDVYKTYLEIVSRQGGALGAIMEEGRLLGLPEISTEGLDQLRKSFPTIVDSGARAIPVANTSVAAAKPAGPTPTPEPPRLLSAEEIRARIVELDPKYRNWLELASPLLTFADLSQFLQMTPAQKDRFIRDFFKAKR